MNVTGKFVCERRALPSISVTFVEDCKYGRFAGALSI
jgi:hypothetical protein